jgi:hypothetical protein
MNETEMQNIWQSYHNKLENSLILNRKNASDITKVKARSYLISMRPMKLFTIIVGILWVILIDIIIVATFPVASPFFLVSAGIQVLITKIAIGVYLYQVVLIERVEINEPIIEVQKRLAELKTSTLWVTRILFLQLPVWNTFYLSEASIQHGGTVFWVIQILITSLFTFISIWLFVNIKYENRDKRWFKLIFEGSEWKPLMKAMGLLEEIKSEKM